MVTKKFEFICLPIPHDYIETTAFDKESYKKVMNTDLMFFEGDDASDIDSDSDRESEDYSNQTFFIGLEVDVADLDYRPTIPFSFIRKDKMDHIYNMTKDILKKYNFNTDNITFVSLSNDCFCCS